MGSVGETRSQDFIQLALVEYDQGYDSLRVY